MLSATPAPWSFAAPWGGQGWLTELGGLVHWVEYGAARRIGRARATPLVLVHGLGGSHLNWALVGSALAADRRVLVPDLRGFGMTRAAGGDVTVGGNATLLDRFIREVVGEPVVLIGNSMGGLISIMHTHRNPETVTGLVLVDPALPAVPNQLDRSTAATLLRCGLPGLGERYLPGAEPGASAARQARQVIELCFADPRRASEPLLAASEALLTARRWIPGTEAAFLAATRSLVRVVGGVRRYRAMMSGIEVPVLLMHGESDRLVSVNAARHAAAANPAWDTCFLPDVGHAPQLEAPDLFVDAVTHWLTGLADTVELAAYAAPTPAETDVSAL
ncbi:MAG TPA: alpha/beta hydrolase [Pseudonocardia sp.]